MVDFVTPRNSSEAIKPRKPRLLESDFAIDLTPNSNNHEKQVAEQGSDKDEEKQRVNKENEKNDDDEERKGQGGDKGNEEQDGNKEKEKQVGNEEKEEQDEEKEARKQESQIVRAKKPNSDANQGQVDETSKHSMISRQADDALSKSEKIIIS